MLAILTLTKNGYQAALRVSEVYPSKIYYKNDRTLDENVKEVFENFDEILFIMATGIVVRKIKDYLVHKSKDPCVLVMDEKCKNIISLIGGHLAGGNALTNLLASKINANPVVTTSSDVNGLMSIDTFSVKYNLVIDSFEDIKNLTALLVDGYKIQLVDIIADEKSYVYENGDAILYKSHIKKEFDLPSAMLRPKNLILSVGCRRGVEFEYLYDFVKKVFNESVYKLESVKLIASAWVKADEDAIIKLSEKLNVEFKTYSKEEIISVHDKFHKSKIALKNIGVNSVSEPCGYLASNKGKNVISRVKNDKVVLSVWEEIC